MHKEEGEKVRLQIEAVNAYSLQPRIINYGLWEVSMEHNDLYPQEAKNAKPSRRDFLKGAVVTGSVAAFAGVMGGLAGCTANEKDEANPSGAVSINSGDVQVSVHESDVLIVGGGLVGCVAARNAIGNGVSVTVVDKGPWGRSGTSGINWGHDMTSPEWSEDDGTAAVTPLLTMNCGMPNQPFLHSLSKAVKKAHPNLVSEQLGGILERDQEGNPLGMNETKVLAVGHGCFTRYYAQNVRLLGAKVFDRTRVLNVLINDEGRVAGAVAIDVKTGSAHVFRAKTTILATGSYAWIAGFSGMYPRTISSPENTGDGHRMLIEAGIAMRDMEQLPVDFVQWNPYPIRQGMGTVGVSIMNHWMAVNNNKERITAEYDGVATFKNSEFMRVCLKTIHKGEGTENGGVFVDTRDLENPTNDRYYRTKRATEALLGYELPDYVEALPEQWETAANPFTIGDNCETEIPGLYFATAGATAWLGSCYFSSQGAGYLSGVGAAQAAKQMEAAPEIPWTKVGKELSDAYALLDAEPASKVRSTDLMKQVQEAYWEGLSPFRDEAGINATIDELDRIETEEFSKVYVPSKSRQYNTDWQRALDIRSLIVCGKGTGQAALLRKETRGAHCRLDYPKMDNANWLVNTKVQLINGKWSGEVVTIDDSIVSADTIAKSVMELGIE